MCFVFIKLNLVLRSFPGHPDNIVKSLGKFKIMRGITDKLRPVLLDVIFKHET